MELSKLLLAAVTEEVLSVFVLPEAATSSGETAAALESTTGGEEAALVGAMTGKGAGVSTAGGTLASELAELLDVAGGDGSSSS